MNSRSIVKSALLAALLVLAPAALALTTSVPPPNSADSANIRVDTRNLTMTQLVITGPTSVPWGQEGTYTAMLSYQGAAAEDVTSQCDWTVTGGPVVTAAIDLLFMNGNVLNPKVVSTVPLKVSAKITRNTGKIASNDISVTVPEGNGMNIGMNWPYNAGPNYVFKSGANFVWHYAADAYGQALMKSGVTVEWFLDGVQVATGASFNQNFTGLPCTKELKVVATDTQGRKGQAIGRVTFNVPPTVNEPAMVRASDPKSGKLVDEDGNPFAFNPLKKTNGLIVVTHGLTPSSNDQTNTDGWLRIMATNIRERLAGHEPNIAVYEWFDFSNPTVGSALDGTGFDLAADVLAIRGRGLERGVDLMDWMNKEIGKGNISPSSAVHLIGHSAGGFVVGECGYQLRSTLGNVRVSMLDTPYPAYTHLVGFPASGRKIDRYISSFFGAKESPLTRALVLPGTYDYVRLNFLLLPTLSAHSYAHEWYDSTVRTGSIGAKGFGWTPFLSSSGNLAAMSFSSLTASESSSLSSIAAVTQTETPLSGFTTFGIVNAVTDGYQITEGNQANSGITLANYAMPVGAQSIRFRFQFTGVGDGDFLVASFGDNPPIGYGSENNTSESEEITVNMPVEHLAGQQGDLVFRLMSRGNQNAVVTLKGITLTEIDDADQDGLTNTQETAGGTNPLKVDSDGDGIDDPTEMNTTLTNPVLADSDGDGAKDGSELEAGTNPLEGSSRFVVKSSLKAGANFTITWSSVAGKTYRIIRSSEPSFESYDVLGVAIPAAPPEQSFTDTGGATGSRMFYRVELEP